MGGSLAWTLRLEDGTEYRMNRWTNTMAANMMTPDFLAGKPEAIDEALSAWLEMKADWEANKATGHYAGVMTSVYAPYPYGMRPSEYGLVVTDFVSKTILSLQGYTSLGKLNAVRQCYGAHAAEAFPGKVEQIEQTARAGKVSHWEITLHSHAAGEHFRELGATLEPHRYDEEACIAYVPGSVDYEELTALCDRVRDIVPPHPEAEKIAAFWQDLEKMDKDDPERAKHESILHMIERAHKSEHSPFIHASAVLSLAPFTLEEFDESSEGFEKLRDRILELGFELSAHERSAWDTQIAMTRRREARDEEDA